jgi:DNA-binding MarR family transcriptional regulator
MGMNKIAQKHRMLAAPKSPRTLVSLTSTPAEVVVSQARKLDLVFVGVARHVLVDDDPAAELPLRQLRVCLALYEGPRTMSQLSRDLRFSLSAMTQIADRLERAGLVTRWFEESDRRVRRLRLTPRARRMLRLRKEARIRRIAAVLERMPVAARVDALTALDALRCAAASHETMNDQQPLGASMG